jgi:hypothetical protein
LHKKQSQNITHPNCIILLAGANVLLCLYCLMLKTFPETLDDQTFCEPKCPLGSVSSVFDSTANQELAVFHWNGFLMMGLIAAHEMYTS